MQKCIYNCGEILINQEKPSFIKLVPTSLKKTTVHEAVRWLVQFPYGYKVYRMYDKKIEVAYCVISRGGSWRYPFSSKSDIIVGPYYVETQFRGNGYAKLLVEKALEENKNVCNKAFAFIASDNIASIKTVKNLNFKYYSGCKYSNKLHILQQTNNFEQMNLYVLEGNNK